MLSGNGFVSASHLASHVAASTASQFQTQFVSSVVAGAKIAGHHLQSSLSATLTDPTNSSASGVVAYTLSKAAHGTSNTNFNVSVTGATANSTFDVAIGGIVVGHIATDANGAGSLALASSPTGSQQALPMNFPTTVDANSVITVGTLTGTLTSTQLSHKTSLTAQLTDSSGSGSGHATFKSNTESGKSDLNVSVRGLAPNSTVDVTIGGTVVGQITTNSRGAGRLRLKNLSTSVSDNSTISIGSLSGAFSTSSSGDSDSDSDSDSD
jgi:hypothetical protein